MGAIFKTSCALFWIIWMSVISAMFGFEHMQQTYTYDKVEDPEFQLMALACGMTIVTAITGSCCVKVDVSNVCCACCYLVGFIVSIVIVCVVLLLQLQLTGNTPHEIDVLRETRRMMTREGTIPRFLHSTQVQYRCCGIYGFKDYRGFIFPPDVKEDVPYSCCKNQSGYTSGRCFALDNDKQAGQGMFNLSTSLKLPIPLPSNKKQYGSFKANVDLYGPSGRCDSDVCISPSLTLPVVKGKDGNINLMGCHEYLLKNTANLHSSFSQFCIFLMACAFLMGLLFTQSCLRARSRAKDGKEALTEAQGMDGVQDPEVDALNAVSDHEPKNLTDPGLDPMGQTESAARMGAELLSAQNPAPKPPFSAPASAPTR